MKYFKNYYWSMSCLETGKGNKPKRKEGVWSSIFYHLTLLQIYITRSYILRCDDTITHTFA